MDFDKLRRFHCQQIYIDCDVVAAAVVVVAVVVVVVVAVAAVVKNINFRATAGET